METRMQRERSGFKTKERKERRDGAAIEERAVRSPCIVTGSDSDLLKCP